MWLQTLHQCVIVLNKPLVHHQAETFLRVFCIVPIILKMEKGVQLFFLDLGLSTAKDGKAQGHILTWRHDGSGLKTIVESIGTAPDGLAIDPEHQRIYYTNMGVPSTDSGFISRVDLDGKNDTAIIPQGVTWTPKQMTLVPHMRKMYWCDREGWVLCHLQIAKLHLC